MATKHEVLQAHLNEWLACKGNKERRGALTKDLSQSLHLHRKSIPRSMRRLQMKSKSKTEQRGRREKYGMDVDAALCKIWEAMEYPCAENMPHEAIDEYVAFSMKARDWNFSNEATDKLLTMSLGTKKLRIAKFRKRRGLSHGRSATVSSPLKGMIPIRKSHTWHELSIGYLQTDSVVHCGDILTDNVIYSVGCVDFATYWTEYTTQWNKGAEVTCTSLKTIRDRFVFKWRELHPDTGNEFINYHLYRWSKTEGIDMTRSEPYKKNDNMCIEERNNSIARRHLGYARMDDISLVPLSSEVLRLACILHNHFRPVRRMISKVRIGAVWKRTFESVAKTPYQRVIAHKDVPSEDKEKLYEMHAGLNPLEIKKKLDILKTELHQKLDYLFKKKSANR